MDHVTWWKNLSVFAPLPCTVYLVVFSYLVYTLRGFFCILVFFSNSEKHQLFGKSTNHKFNSFHVFCFEEIPNSLICLRRCHEYGKLIRTKRQLATWTEKYKSFATIIIINPIIPVPQFWFRLQHLNRLFGLRVFVTVGFLSQRSSPMSCEILAGIIAIRCVCCCISMLLFKPD